MWRYCLTYDLIARGPICATCNYNLYGSTSDTCPECGADVRAVREEAKRFTSEENE